MGSSMRSSTARVDVLLAAPLAEIDRAQDDFLAMTAALQANGVAARPWRPWEDSLSASGCLHLFGAAEEFLPLVDSALRQGLKVVLSPDSVPSHTIPTRFVPPLFRGAVARLSRYLSGASNVAARLVPAGWMRRPGWQSELFHRANVLLSHTNAEAQQWIRQFDLPAAGVRVLPYAVNPKLAHADPHLFRRHAGVNEFVLYYGDIEPHNEQLGFLLALKEEKLPIVMMGNTTKKYRWYAEECRRVAWPQVHFLPAPSGPSDPLLASAMVGASCVTVGCQVSAAERIALMAGASGAPLVLFEGGSGNEYFGHQAAYVAPGDLPGIRRGVLAAIESDRSRSLAEHVRTYFSWDAIAKTLREVYGRTLRDQRRASDEVDGSANGKSDTKTHGSFLIKNASFKTSSGLPKPHSAYFRTIPSSATSSKAK